jgi:hypothetical protein
MKGGLSAVLGASLWLVLAVLAVAGFVSLSLIDVLLLLAPLVVVPLGIDLLPVAEPQALLRVARIGQPIAACAVVVAMLLPTGWMAGLLAGAWLIPSGLIGLSGLYLLFTERSIRPQVLAPAAAMSFLAVGGGWLFLSRAGLPPGGFSPAIVELTAVHFHFACFAATLLAALTLARLPGRPAMQRFAALGSYLMIVGTPLVAIGIALVLKPLALAGAGLLASGVVIVVAVTVLAVVPAAPKLARILLTTSALSVFLPMALAFLYTARPLLGTPALGLQEMAATHGVLNSLAFSVLGLLGWRLAKSDSPARRSVNVYAQA